MSCDSFDTDVSVAGACASEPVLAYFRVRGCGLVSLMPYSTRKINWEGVPFSEKMASYPIAYALILCASSSVEYPAYLPFAIKKLRKIVVEGKGDMSYKTLLDLQELIRQHVADRMAMVSWRVF